MQIISRTSGQESKPNNLRLSSPQIGNNMKTLICLLTITSIASIGHLAASAVVRPTIFSGLNGPEASPQVPSSQQPAQRANQHQNSPQQPETASQQPPAQVQQPSTKINPLKSRFCHSASGQRQDSPLGLQSMELDDLALTASSYSNEQVGPHLARLRQDISGGAWCPMKPISSNTFGKEWIQAKLNRSFVISAIETQGRYGMGNGKESVPSYQVEYSRNGGNTWHKWKDFRGSYLLRGNEDVNSVVRNELSPPIVGANVIRILPYSLHLRTVCLRFELHGCPYDEGAPVSYSTNDGVVEPRWGHLIDYTYDGLRRNSLLSQGLGQLVDGIKGHDNFSYNNGFEWVGWKSMNGDVVIEFSFKTLRNFTGALFHSNNLFSNGVEVFQSVDVQYGIDVPLSMEALRDALHEQRNRDALSRRLHESQASSAEEPHSEEPPTSQQTLWSADVMSIEYEPDKKVESSRPVTVHLKQRLANKLRFTLKFASKWILVSEVEFLSYPVELLSLATIDSQTTPALLNVLAPVKTYDEFVAIVRENQLRRIAHHQYLESISQPTVGGLATQTQLPPFTSSAPASSTEGQPSAPSANEPSGDQPRYEDYPTRTKLADQSLWPQTSNSPTTFQDLAAGPSINPLISNQFTSPYGPLGQPPMGLPSFPPDNTLAQESPSPAGILNTGSGQPQQSRTIGLATVISFVLVAVLVILGLLFAISTYRMRQQPNKLASGLSAHHLGAAIGSPAKGLVQSTLGPAGLQNFINVLSSGSTSQGAHADHLASGQHLYQAQDNQYNPVFGTHSPAARRPPAPAIRERATGSTLRKLATLGTKSGAPMKTGQLLVSLKNSANGKGPTNTQLIVGLNQANPMAQQQIYSAFSGHHQQPTYGQANYSTSLSMASTSTTTGHQGEYGDYAIPDAQPMIPSVGLGHSQQQTSKQLLYGIQTPGQQQQQPNQPFNGNQLQPFSGGFGPELRSSHRIIQPQILHHRMPVVGGEHNYELIQHQEPTNGSQNLANDQRVLHNRTLSNQQAMVLACQGQQQQSSSAQFGSMTLGRPSSHLQLAAGCQEPNQMSLNSGTSANTATTSANSSAGNSDLAHYYYATNANN